MVNRIIDEINVSLDNGCYMAALSLALMLPDICGCAEYGVKEKNGIRYIGWYDKYIGQYEKNPSKLNGDENIHYLSGEVVYSLRNNVLHQGTPNINKGKGNIDKFTLTIEREDYGVYVDAISTKWHNDDKENAVREYRVNIRRLCFIITANAKKYYADNKERFDFFNYEIIDMDAVAQSLHRIGIIDMIAEQIKEIDYGNK